MSLFKPHLYEMGAYQPPLEGRSVSQHLLLDFNERTLPVSDRVTKALSDFIYSGQIQKYPSYGDIVERMIAYVGVETGQLMITNGSDQGIDLAVRACLNPGDEAIIPGPTFAMYEQCARIENARVISPQYTCAGGYPVDEVLAALTPHTRLVIVPLPNNPTGTGIEQSQLVRILDAAASAVVLVDECYFEYSGLSAVDLVDDYPNLVITRTFSKTWGLPSLRFGFVISQSANIDQLLKIRGPYDINQLAVVAAGAALDDPGYTNSYVNDVMLVSKPRLEGWLRQEDIGFWPSCANFIWMFPLRSAQLQERLQSAGILVRPKSDAMGNIGLRVTLGTPAQTERLIREMQAFLDGC